MLEQQDSDDGVERPVSNQGARPRTRVSRRVTRPAPEGVDPTPQNADEIVKAAEDQEQAWGEGAVGNDADLKRNKPPHWG
ncbi:hypothetical protein [Lysinibacter cavernae]|uniref:Uncharacterized protein n=1 Tax=Lysinibacter cavernae TaxID=1640652 RepID=A0A7X5TUZ8_9MICO|nr:hypothetical protein [Lysinibacter cavernae]NIH55028.1 hypothetical protein [Lysinibacter cavernae]